LPHISSRESPNFAEWQTRAASLKKLQRHFKSIDRPKRLLDVGCGNGWAAAGLAENKRLEVSAVDINMRELEQADRVFQKPNLQFYFGDIFKDIFQESSFDIIVLNSSAQYFPDIKALVERLFYFLKKGGELHIIDTPLYKDEELAQARNRTEAYYRSLRIPEMAQHYYHHKLTALASFKHVLHKERGMYSKIGSIFRTKSPRNFIWVIIRKEVDAS